MTHVAGQTIILIYTLLKGESYPNQETPTVSLSFWLARVYIYGIPLFHPKCVYFLLLRKLQAYFWLDI